jgi:hypothetical protein
VTSGGPGSRHAWVVGLVGSLCVAVLLLGPALLWPGTVLRGDMVFVPHQPWKDAWLGLDGSVPRAVPMDALVSLATYVVPGDWLQKAVLLSSFVVGGTGIARLATGVVGADAWGVAASVTLFLWNPWVVERLSIGQWATVAGYALLPWVVSAAWRLRDYPTRWGEVLLHLALSAACSPSSGVTAVLVAAVVVLAAPTRRAVRALVLSAVVANLPWAVPALTLGNGVELAAGAGFESFRAVGESALGLVPSALSLGGIWKVSVVPGERAAVLVVALAVLLSTVGVAGMLRAKAAERMRGALLTIGALAVGLCVVPAYGAAAFSSAAEVVPGLSMLRDTHRFLAPLALPLAVGLAAVVSELHRRASRGREGLVIAAGTLVVSPLLLLPSAVWGLTGDLRPVPFPDEWQVVADELEAAGPNGSVVALPWEGSYRRFGWNDGRATLDPAPRLLPGDVLVDDRIVLGDEVLPHEDPRLAAVTVALSGAAPSEVLREIGVRWVLVEKPLPPSHGVPAGDVVVDAPGLQLVDLGAPSVPAAVGAWEGRRWLVVASDLVVLLSLLAISVVQRGRGRYAPART